MSDERYTLLVVDDVPSTLERVRQAGRQSAEAAGIELAVVGTGPRDLLAALRSSAPDAVIIAAPSMASEQVSALDLVCADPAWSDVRLLVLTGDSLQPRLDRLVQDYGVEAVHRDADGATLTQAVSALLARVPRRMARRTAELPSLERLRLLKLLESEQTPAGATPPAAASGRPRRPRRPQAGDQVGNYILEQQLSGAGRSGVGRQAGAMGVVFRARHRTLDKVVALKLLGPESVQLEGLVERFRREPLAAGRIGHPNIVEVLDAGNTQDGGVYFVMEHLSGRDLAATLAADGPLAVHRTLVIGAQLCDAVGAAHRAGLVHRDLKPRHIFLVQRGTIGDLVKVLDFGVVKVLDQDIDAPHALTVPGVVLGTPTYMAPEQGEAKPFDHRIDVYAVGVILYEALTGRPPHPCDSLTEAIVRKATEPVQPLLDLRPDLPPPLAQQIEAALEYDVRKRPATMEQMGQALRALIPAGVESPVLRLLEALRA